MSNYTWSIKGIESENEVITCAKYQVIANDDDNSVETEGNWYFNGTIDKSFADITEQDVIDLIQKESVKDGVNIIESRLNEQLVYLANNTIETIAPWLPQTFTPS